MESPASHASVLPRVRILPRRATERQVEGLSANARRVTQALVVTDVPTDTMATQAKRMANACHATATSMAANPTNARQGRVSAAVSQV